MSVNNNELKLTDIDGRNFSYAEYGDPEGLPVIYCHGVNGTRLQGRIFAESAKNQGVRIISIDRPGYGGSDNIDNYNSQDWAEDLPLIMKKLGLEKVGLLALSAGSNYAFAAAIAYPEFYTRLVSIGGTTGAYRQIRKYGFTDRTFIPDFLINRLVGKLFLYQNKYFSRYFPAWHYYWQMRMLEKPDRILLRKKNLRKLFANLERETFRQGMEPALRDLIFMFADTELELEKLRIPVSCWFGGLDKIVQPVTAQYLKQKIPNLQVTVKQNAGHLLVFEYTSEILAEFLI